MFAYPYGDHLIRALYCIELASFLPLCLCTRKQTYRPLLTNTQAQCHFNGFAFSAVDSKLADPFYVISHPSTLCTVLQYNTILTFMKYM